MKRVLVLALGLFVLPAVASAQVEVGVDGFFVLSNPSEPEGATGDFDNTNSFSLPSPAVRVAFPAGETLLVESLVGFNWSSTGDVSGSSLLLMPGLSLLVGEQFYVRGEAGLMRTSFDSGTASSSATQYAFGGGGGMRMPLGDAAILRLEAVADWWLENEDDGILGRMDIRVGAGISAVVN